MNNAKIPELDDGTWEALYTKDCYYDPKGETVRAIKLRVNMSKRDFALREKLLPFWFAKATRFAHRGGQAGCITIRPMHEEVAVITWGLTDDEEHWARALRTRKGWRILTPQEKWEFGFTLNDKADGFEKICLYIGEEEIAQY